ncbi:glycosyltransferase [Morganella morganii]|uniref:glycosyltransferase family A protein n=1 Tax=Morganella morganii TaxID=582 RepID=UPI0025A6798D|nr:glycosyltransferase family A protein [Morganella morganii]
MKTFQILMATMHKSKISDLDWNYKNTSANILLINQSDFSDIEVSNNIKMISTTDRGSSNSRNMAIKNSDADICLISDDDVRYIDDVDTIVTNAFDENPTADIITFQIITPEGNPFNSGYIKNKRWHTKRTILKCASIEIAFKRDKIIEHNLLLDTDFGLGSKYRVHDEVIFLNDALKAGLKLLYIPIPIVYHPAESSGTDYNDHLIISKGAAFIRLFGRIGFVMNILFALKKHREYSHKYSFFSFMKKINSGSIKYLKEKK